MYLSATKTLLVEAILSVFDEDYPFEEYRGIHCSIEYPKERQHYPGIWVDFATSTLQNVGIAHVEFSEPGTDGGRRMLRRWRFDGNAQFTLAGMSSLARDNLYDHFVGLIAFGQQTESTSDFIRYIEDNDLIAVTLDTDELAVSGFAATPGTPWGTDDIIYEATINVELVGEFVSDASSRTLVPLSGITLEIFDDTEVLPGVPDLAAPGSNDWQ